MSKVKFVLNNKNVAEQIRKSPEVTELLRQKGADIVASAGEGYTYAEHSYARENAINVYPETREARQDNFDNNTLFRLIGL